MPAGWAAAAAAAAGALTQADASRSASNKQQDAAKLAANTSTTALNTTNAQTAPFRDSANSALAQLNDRLGFAKPTQSISDIAAQIRSNFPNIQGNASLTNSVSDQDLVNGFLHSIPAALLNPNGATPEQQDKMRSILSAAQQATAPGATPGSTPTTADTNSLTHTFTAADINSNLAPNYQFQLDQGLGAVKNAGNLQTGLLSGNTIKGANDYAQNFAGNAYQNAFNNFNTNQSNIFNRLSTIAGFGPTTNQTTANAGTNLAGNIGSAQLAGGAAGAAGTVGAANALAGGANNAASWYTLSKLMNPGTGQTATADPNFTDDAAMSLAASG